MASSLLANTASNSGNLKKRARLSMKYNLGAGKVYRNILDAPVYGTVELKV